MASVMSFSCCLGWTLLCTVCLELLSLFCSWLLARASGQQKRSDNKLAVRVFTGDKDLCDDVQMWSGVYTPEHWCLLNLSQRGSQLLARASGRQKHIDTNMQCATSQVGRVLGNVHQVLLHFLWLSVPRTVSFPRPLVCRRAKGFGI